MQSDLIGFISHLQSDSIGFTVISPRLLAALRQLQPPRMEPHPGVHLFQVWSCPCAQLLGLSGMGHPQFPEPSREGFALEQCGVSCGHHPFPSWPQPKAAAPGLCSQLFRLGWAGPGTLQHPEGSQGSSWTRGGGAEPGRQSSTCPHTPRSNIWRAAREK